MRYYHFVTVYVEWRVKQREQLVAEWELFLSLPSIPPYFRRSFLGDHSYMTSTVAKGTPKGNEYTTDKLREC